MGEKDATPNQKLVLLTMDTLPPTPTFVSEIYSFSLSVLVFTNGILDTEIGEMLPAPLLLVPVIHTFLMLLLLLALFGDRKYGLIRGLFPSFRSMKN